MTAPFHTYGPSCLLADDEPELRSFYSVPTPPDVRSQFFYISSLPIDDPLAPLPLQTGQSTANERALPQPFSARDNIALEKAWRELGEARQANHADKGGSRPATSKGQTGIPLPDQRPPLEAERQRTNSAREEASLISRRSTPPSVSDETPSRSLQNRAGYFATSSDSRVEGSVERRRVFSSLDAETAGNVSSGNGLQRKRERSTSVNDSPLTKRRNSTEEDGAEESGSLRTNRSRDASISGSPFIRAPISQSYSGLGRSAESLPFRDGAQEGQAESQSASNWPAPKPSGLRSTLSFDQMAQGSTREEPEGPQTEIVVGASRIHSVELPNLKMKPIYWRPLGDVSSVVRATWFYKNTMLPVETELANKLEEGYNYLKPWTDTWQDELNSCVENGAEAESKIVHQLWPKDEPGPATRPGTTQDSKSNDSETRPVPEGGSFDKNHAAGGPTAPSDTKPHSMSGVIYVDARNAQILRPSLLPSASRGRRPLSAIRKERQIGIPVVRGFSRKLWDRLHPSKPNPVDVRQYVRRNQSRNAVPVPGVQVCYACKMEGMRPSPTDLVLVIHGIGQKLSERMESWHFTHAINAFRRQVNMELNGESVWPHVDKDHGGIMVLPVNWRSTLSLGDPSLETPGTEDPDNVFSLDDITPETLPAVRSLVSDVMLDIPYYLSHHKPKMVRAVVREANRIYRLWCKNNAGFQENGRVHLVAHSLGSVMAVDILSQQPTNVPHFDLSSTPLHADIFEFDTRHLFLCGSPVGFFLLLNKATLLPRKGRNKPGNEGEDRCRGVAGEAGRYGCIAVDNLYNIMHTTDPIAYRVNAAVDTDLSNSLKTAPIPSSTSSIWSSFGNVFRWSSTTPFVPSTAAPTRPAAVSKLPSTVEMETHDFTREEIAEKRMLLLNDNGQIDYYLSGGGGPLNIQYLNMLSAHSSYWTLTDFVRFFVVEIARKQGRAGTLAAFRAEKKKGWRYSKG